jgi:YHS domain-containing protein
MKIQFAIILTASIFLAQCNTKKSNSEKEIKQDTLRSAMQKATDRFKGLQFANTKDYSCGMPVSAGVEDTAHYKGKLYGFCSAECKADFLSKPEEYLSKK